VVYSGSLERIDFSEEKDEKGFYVVDLNTTGTPGQRCTAFHFHPVSARRFLTIEVQLEAGMSDPTNTVLSAVVSYEHKIKDAIVRVIVHLPEQLEGQLQESEVRRALNKAHHLSITRDVRRESRVRMGGHSAEELTPLQAMAMYLDSKKTPPNRKKTLLEYTQDILEDREAQHE
jgi:exonuclease SbcD